MITSLSKKFYLFLKLQSFVVVCLLFSACSFFQPRSTQSDKETTSPYLGVDFDEREKLKLDSDSLKMQSKGLKDGKTKRVPVVSFHFNPGQEDIFALIGVLKVLEKEGVKPKLLSGHGWGFILAALLAKFEKVNSLEWAMLKLSYKLKKKSIQISSAKGLDEFKKFALEIFKESRVEHLPITLVLPSWDNQARAYKLIKRGKVKKLFEQALMENFDGVFKSHKSLYPDQVLMRTGSDIPISFNVVHRSSHYLKEDRVKWNNVLKLQSESFSSSHRVFEMSQTPNESMDNLSDYIKRGEQYGHSVKVRVQELLEEWSTKAE